MNSDLHCFAVAVIYKIYCISEATFLAAADSLPSQGCEFCTESFLLQSVLQYLARGNDLSSRVGKK